ncbi:MAG: transposase [Pirellulaceae bacterium]
MHGRHSPDTEIQTHRGRRHADHVHLLVLLDKQLALAELLRELKSAASQWIHDAFPASAKLRLARGIRSVRREPLQFAAGDPLHCQSSANHHAQSYRDEFTALLKKHEIEFDERYL